ncbi:energy transducer TonB [Bacillus sp. NP157]|nr:energy transducer TonB [Bacillus sp. NP157]
MGIAGKVRYGAFALGTLLSYGANAAQASQEDIMAQAAALRSHPQAPAYLALMQDELDSGMQAVVEQCSKVYSAANTQALVVSAQVRADGGLRDANIVPDTPFTQCVGAAVARHPMPAPPASIGRFFAAWLVEVPSGKISDPFLPADESGMAMQDRRRIHGPTYSPPPVYPSLADGSRPAGKTIVHTTMDSRGIVSSATVETSSGDANLDAAAIAAVKQWTFRPGAAKGTAVNIPVAFQDPKTVPPAQ